MNTIFRQTFLQNANFGWADAKLFGETQQREKCDTFHKYCDKASVFVYNVLLVYVIKKHCFRSQKKKLNINSSQIVCDKNIMKCEENYCDISL